MLDFAAKENSTRTKRRRRRKRECNGGTPIDGFFFNGGRLIDFPLSYLLEGAIRLCLARATHTHTCATLPSMLLR